MNLGSVISDWRYMNKLTMQGAADRIGIPVSVLGQLEAGKDVKGSNLATVLAWLMREDLPAGPQQLALEDQRARAVG